MAVVSIATRIAVAVSLGATSVLASGAAAADTWKPNKPIHLLVGFAPGGSADTLGRLIADPLSKELGAQVVVENLAGAGGNIMAQRLSQAKPDGYTIGVSAAGSMAIAHALKVSSVQYKPQDFQPITLLATQPNVVIINNDVPARNLAEFVSYVKATPSSTYGIAGIGISNHLIAEAMLQRAGVKMEVAAYRGAAPVITDLLGGHIQMSVDNISTAAQLVAQGKVRAIAVTTKERATQLPDVPTLEEQGISNFDMPTWQGLFAPAGLPADILATYQAALQKVLKSDELHQKMAVLGSSPVVGMSTEAFTTYVADDIKRWEQISKDGNITLN